MHRLWIEPNQKCSRHYHRDKRNMFHVILGRLVINVWRNGDMEPMKFELEEGDTYIVESGVEHQFVTQEEACECLEVYWLTDISRKATY